MLFGLIGITTDIVATLVLAIYRYILTVLQRRRRWARHINWIRSRYFSYLTFRLQVYNFIYRYSFTITFNLTR
jgi:hypothetical protein